MIPLYTEEEFKLAKDSDKLPCKCIECGTTFFKLKRVIKRTFISYNGNTGNFCSRRCVQLSKKNSTEISCKCCNKTFIRINSQIKKSKNNFCSHSCSTTYNNTHKKYGTRISKLEKWLKEQLIELYPDLEMLFNDKKIINSELDIYIPSLKLAFELNGIFHYEPIYGNDKLQKIQNNDNRKFQACLEHGIELCIIDTSQQKYFKEKTSQKYLNIIIKNINIHR